MMTETPPTDTGTYHDDDLVYVDPDARSVVGRVEFKESGLPIPKEMVSQSPMEDDEDTEKSTAKVKARRPLRKPRKRYYPWGTYRTMKKIYKIEGKVFEPERTLTLDDVMEKALQEPYWD